MFFSKCDKQTAFDELSKVLLFIYTIYMGSAIKQKGVILNIIFYAASILGFVNTLTYFYILPIEDAVYIVNGIPRLQSVFQYANATALFLGCGYLCGIQGIETEKNMTLKFFMLSVILISLLLTLSRLGILLFILSLAFVLYKLTPSKTYLILAHFVFCIVVSIMSLILFVLKYKFLAFILCIICIILAVPNIVRRNKDKKFEKKYLIFGFFVVLAAFAAIICYTIVSDQGSNFSKRMIFAKDAFFTIIRNPLGIGLGAWDIRQYAQQSSSYYVRYVHNCILQSALDGGIAFMIANVVLVISTIIIFIKKYKKDKDGKNIYFAVIITYISAHSCFDIGLSMGAIIMLLGLCIAAVQDTSCKTPHKIQYVKIVSAILLVAYSFYQIIGMALQYSFEKQYLRGSYRDCYKTVCYLEKLRPLESINKKNKAAISLHLGKNDESVLQLLYKASELSPYNITYINDLIFVEKDNNPEKALELCKKYISMAPYQPLVYETAQTVCEELYKDNKIIEEEYTSFKKEIEKNSFYEE